MNEHFFDVSPYVQKYVNVNFSFISKTPKKVECSHSRKLIPAKNL